MTTRLIKSIARKKVTVPAHQAVKKALKNGTLKKADFCLYCKKYGDRTRGPLTLVAHHTDYSKPLDVIWLCTIHHDAWHRVFIPDNNEGDTKGIKINGFMPAIRKASGLKSYGIAQALRAMGIDITTTGLVAYDEIKSSMRLDVLCGLYILSGLTPDQFIQLLIEKFAPQLKDRL